MEKKLVQTPKIKVLYSNELPIHQSKLIEELRKKTIFGMPTLLYEGYNIFNLNIFLGANQHPLEVSVRGRANEGLHAMDGYPYINFENESSKVEFISLNTRNQLQTKQVLIEKYYQSDVFQSLNRFKHKLKKGLSIYCFFPEEFLQNEIPLQTWSVLVDRVNQMASDSLLDMLNSQVSAIENRIRSISNRRRVKFKGEVLGLVPNNELETVILYERYITKNNNVFGKNSRLHLLEYSPQGIDSVCSFAASPSEPITNVAVEFEYLLQNFFDHGHDPQQVRLILCYSMKNIQFPYDHFGVIFHIERSGNLPKLVNTNTGNSCYVFALDEVIEEVSN